MEPIREFEPGDLTWLLLIAKQYGEQDGFLASVERFLVAWVVPGHALVCLMRTGDGSIRAAGLTDRKGIRDLIRAGRCLRAFVGAHRMFPVWAAVESCDHWQRRFFEQLGFISEGQKLWLRG